jgi:flagellar biosynthetic protein FliR
MDDLARVLQFVPGIVLHMARIAGFLAVAPVFSAPGASRLLRMILTVALGSTFWWIAGPLPAPQMHVLEFVVAATREVVIGLALGFAVQLILSLLLVAGEILSHEMGFTMARVLNPVTDTSSTAMSQLFEVMGFMMILQLNLHHAMLRGLQHAYEVLPVGRSFDFEPVHARLTAMVGESMELGLRYAMPVFGVMILLTVVLVVLARAVPNINLLEFSFGLRILLAFGAAIYFLVEGAPFLADAFQSLLGSAHSLVDGL